MLCMQMGPRMELVVTKVMEGIAEIRLNDTNNIVPY